MKYLETNLQSNIERKLQELDKLRPLPASAVEKLQRQFQIEMTYNSNAIEGNRLTLKETFLVINEGITIKGRPLKDHLEAKDHQEALEYLYSLAEKGKRNAFSEQVIRALHQLVMRETDREWAGKYRNSNVIIAGADHSPLDALDVPTEMEKLIKWLKQNKKRLRAIEMAALLHHKLVYIHPFFDGNGRTARLAMNLLLMQEGYPLAIVLKNDRGKYYRVLQQADKGDFIPFIRFVAQSISRSLDIYLKVLTPASKKREKYAPLSEISKQSRYSAKYLNLLARNGRLEAHKEGRIWFATKEAIERYFRSRQRMR